MKKLINNYEPSEPYVIQSGKREGKVLELLMFNDYSFLRWHLGKIRQKHSGGAKNRYHRHLEWLMDKGESREPKMKCPICGQRAVKYFSVRFSRGTRRFSISPRYTCCKDSDCQDMLRAGAFGDNLQYFRPLFSNITRITKFKVEQKRIADLYKEIFNLSTKRLTRKAAFKFFKE